MAVYKTLIQTQTIGGVNNFSFTSIPQTFTDLELVISARVTGSTANQGMYIQLNGDGGTVYSGTILRSFGSGMDTFRFSGSNAFGQIDLPNDLNTASTYSNASVYFPNYRSSNFKQVLVENVKESNTTTTAVMLQLQGNLWRNTSAITSIGIGTNISAPNFAGNSVFSLYGIKNS